MDLPCPEWVQHVEQKWTQLGSAGRESFSVLEDINEMFHFAQSHVQQEDINSLSKISEMYPVKKSAECASRFREQGNLSFKIKEYTAAAFFYSKGLCHAGKGTEQLSLCYANRSAALFHLSLYNKCLEDIQRAFDEGYPSSLQCKLINRQTQCMNWLKKQEESKASSSEHQKPQTAEKKAALTCLPAGVSVCFTLEKGRHLLATEKKSAGEIVIKDRPFSFVLVPGNGHYTNTTKACLFGTEHSYCHHCLFKTLSSVPCLGCSYAQYCGHRCASEAWRQYHQWECPAGSELLALGVLAHLALRVSLKAGLKEVQKAKESCFNTINNVPEVSGVSGDRNNGKSNICGGSSNCVEESLSGLCRCSECSEHFNCYHGKSYLGIYSLLPHVVSHSPTFRFLLAFTVAVLCQKLKKVGPVPETWRCCEREGGIWLWGAEQTMLGTTTLRHMMQLRCNAQAVTAIRVKEDSSSAVQSSEEVRIATAVFPILSLLNHSCSPNTSISFSVGLSYDCPDRCASGVTVTVRTCKDIAAGQELLHCYGPHYSRMDVEQRQHLLLEQYFFHCRCEACEMELGSGTKKNAATSKGLKCEKCGNFLQGNADVNVCSEPSCDYQISNLEVQRRLQILQQHLNHALELIKNNRVGRAQRILQEAVAQADSILMKTHPVQGELSDATARVYATMGDWRQAALHLKDSVAAVCSQYGENSVELGQQLYKLTQLHFNGKDRESALSIIPSARRLLSLHCDPCSEELQELLQMEACLHEAV